VLVREEFWKFVKSIEKIVIAIVKKNCIGAANKNTTLYCVKDAKSRVSSPENPEHSPQEYSAYSVVD